MVAGTRRAPIRILHDFLDILRNIIRNIRKDMRKEIRIRILLKTPLGGVPPPLVFEVGRFVAWKEVLKDCGVKLGVLFKSWVMRGFWGGSGQVLDESWARPGHLLAILVGFWEALGRLLGCLGHSWAALGLSWAALGRSRAALERSWTPSWSQDGPQEAQSRPQDRPKSRPRWSKIALICKIIFRSPF